MIRQRPQARSNNRPFNNLLCTLNAKDFDLIAPHLEAVTLAANATLYGSGDDVGIVYFPCGPSLVSYLISNEDGREVEILLVGREGAVGGIVGQARLRAYSFIVVRFGGQFVRLHISKLKAVKAKSPTLSNVFARCAECLLAQILQAAACNAIHSIEQRTAKWIISADDVGCFAEPVIGRAARSKAMRGGRKISCRFRLFLPVQSPLQKYSASRFTQIKSRTPAVLSLTRGVSRSSRT